MRFSALWMLAIGLFSVGLRGEEIRPVSSSDPIPLGAPFQAKIEKSAIFPTPLCPGSSISYQITLTNQSNEGTPGLTASIGDPIPAGTTYVAGSATNGSVFSSEQNRVVWTGSLGGPAFPPSHTIAFSVTVNQGITDGTRITNTANGALILPDQGVLLRRAELSLGINCSQPPITFTFTKDREFAQPLHQELPPSPRRLPGDHDRSSELLSKRPSHEPERICRLFRQLRRNPRLRRSYCF